MYKYKLIKWKMEILKKLTWLARHIGMMMGAYIGTIKVFITVNIKGPLEYNWMIWLGPPLFLCL
jgi:hypothetical protein